MSLQRVLETARKTGMPVIMTDIAGREPMVILPLEQFEAMAGLGSDTSRSSAPSEPIERKPSPPSREEPQTIPVVPSEPEAPKMEEMAKNGGEGALKKRLEETAAQLEALVEKGGESAEFSLEERFYLEPIDEKGTT